MTSRDFCFWLQGFFEVAGERTKPEAPEIGRGQAQLIQQHLALVFKHEIDPAMGGPEKQADLNKIHNSHLTAPPGPGPVMRC
jgi:hypothetical protein